MFLRSLVFRPIFRFNLTWAVVLLGLAAPALAHNVEVAGDVAATMHIEPNHNPKAGEPALTWFALTRQGGQLIPLQQCNCQLRVYTEPYKEGNAPVLQPVLTAIAAEQYQNIPGAKIVFPKSGQYTLEISGSPKRAGDFQPFELHYSVTVLAGVTPPSQQATAQPQPSAKSSNESASQSSQGLQPLLITGAIAVGLGLAGTLAWQRKQK